MPRKILRSSGSFSRTTKLTMPVTGSFPRAAGGRNMPGSMDNRTSPKDTDRNSGKNMEQSTKRIGEGSGGYRGAGLGLGLGAGSGASSGRKNGTMSGNGMSRNTMSEDDGNYAAPFGGYDDEKSAYKTTGRSEYKDQSKATYSEECETVPVGKEKCEEDTEECANGWGYGCIWLIILFIFIVIIMFGFFWFAKPDFVTQDCEDGDGREISPVYAGGFAFFIAFFFIILIGTGWYAMSGRKGRNAKC